MNPGLVPAAWAAFGLFLVMLATRSVLAERAREPSSRPHAILRGLDVTTGAAAVLLVVLLGYFFLATLLS